MSGTATVDRVLHAFQSRKEPIEKYLYLRKLLEDDADDYYRLLTEHTESVLPYIYTPTVGEACERYHTLPGLKPRGLYLSIKDKGHILEKLRAWPKQHVRVVVVTDGERILGLGDLGTGGMGISEGKITLYTVAAGVDPSLCLPVCLDVGTDNKKLLDDPSYPGLRQSRVRGEAYDSFMSEFMSAMSEWQPHVLVQFEDFGNTNAFRLLEQFGHTHCCFNDDIQGTAAITLAALLAAGKATGVPLKDQKVLFMGAGEAGTGIGELIAYCVHRSTGISRKEARQQCYFMDSQGLVCASRYQSLAHHKQPFAHDMPHTKDLLTAVETIKPTALIGVCTIAGAFNEPIVRAMSRINKHPIIFPLSNPTSKSECTFKQAWEWTEGRVVFASGSPFDPISAPPLHTSTTGHTRTVTPAQANNAYIFPAVGMAAVLSRASFLGDEAFLVAAMALAELTDPKQVLESGELFPPFSQILQVSSHVAAAVAEYLVSCGQGTRPFPFTGSVNHNRAIRLWADYVKSQQWHGPGGSKGSKL